MNSTLSKWPKAVFLLLLASLMSSCSAYENRLLARAEGLRLAGMRIYSGEDLSASEEETLVAEFHTVRVSFFRVQERRESLLKLYHGRKKAGYYDKRDHGYYRDGFMDPFYDGMPPEYSRRRRASSR